MSYIPSELNLIEPTLGNVFNIIATDKGVAMQTLANTDNIIISTLDADPLNTITLDAPITKLRTDTLYIEGKTSGSSYTLPTVQPTDNSVIEFMANGTSQFVPNGGGGGAVNAVLNTAYPTTANAGSILVMNGGDAVSSSPTDAIIVDPDFVTVTSTGLTIRGNAVSGTSTIISELVGEFVISNKAPNGTMLLSTEGDITLETLANIQLTGGVNITGGDNTNNIYKNSGNELKLNGENNVYLNSSAGSTFIQSSGGNINIDAPSGVISLACIGDINLTPTYGSTKINNNTMLKFPDGSTATEAQLRQNTQGIFTLTNNGGMLLTTGGGAGLSLTETDTNLTMNIGNGKGNGYIQTSNDTQNLELSTSLTDPVNALVLRSPNINIEDGDVSIIKVEPKLNFIHTDYPTQQCNIRFQTNTEELILEHFTPDNAARTQLRLGINDINLEILPGLQPGNINLRTSGSGQTYINDYKLPNINPTADGQLLSCNINGESSWISPTIPQITYTYWVSNQGNDAFNGSIITPFATIARALTEANTQLETDKVIINVMAGVYNEGALSITKNNITINGGTAIPSQTIVEAVITHTIDNTAGALIASSLYGLTVRGVVYAGSSVEDGSYVIGACVIGTTQSGIIPFVNSYSLAGSRDITVSNCVLNAYDTVGLTTLSGRINSTATLFTQSFVQLSNIYPVLEATGNGLLALFGCQVFSLNNQATNVPPIISLANTIAPSSSHTFNSCTIQYVFGTVNTGTLNKVAIGCTNTVGISMLAYNNLIISEGTRISNGGVQYVIISKQGAGAVVLQYGQNLCGATVHRYPTAASKTQLVTAIA